MTRADSTARPPQGAGNPTPKPHPAPCDPVPDDLVDRIIEAIHREEA